MYIYILSFHELIECTSLSNNHLSLSEPSLADRFLLFFIAKNSCLLSKLIKLSKPL